MIRLPSEVLKSVKKQLFNKNVFIGTPLDNAAQRCLQDLGLNLLNAESTVFTSRRTLLDGVKGVEAICCCPINKIDKEVMDKAGEQLRLICTFSTGFDHIDIQECKARNIKVGSLNNILSESCAEFCVGLILAVGRKIVEGNNLLKNGEKIDKWTGGMGLKESTVGIVGFGNIGRKVAELLRPFGVKRILFTVSRTQLEPDKQSLADKLGAERVDFDDLVASSDFLVVLCSLNKSTTGLINRDVFVRMKKSAIFVNCSRGAVVNQDDLCWALENGEIWGAGLDVTCPEPLPPTHPLLNMARVVVTPHLSGGTLLSISESNMITAQNIIYGLADLPMPFRAN